MDVENPQIFRGNGESSGVCKKEKNGFLSVVLWGGIKKMKKI